MCMMSVVMDYGRRDIWGPQWPQWVPVAPPVPTAVPVDQLKAYLQMIEAAKKFDNQTKQPECEDPAKVQVMDRILERLTEIEKYLGIGA